MPLNQVTRLDFKRQLTSFLDPDFRFVPLVAESATARQLFDGGLTSAHHVTRLGMSLRLLVVVSLS